MSHPFQTASDVRKQGMMPGEMHKGFPKQAEEPERPAEPKASSTAWYRGWEISFNEEAEKWTRTGWQAYKGGCDLDAPQVDAKTFSDCLDAIDETEDA